MISLTSTTLTQFWRFSASCAVINLVFAFAVHAADAGPLMVKDFAGAVKLKIDDRWQDPETGMTVRIPATVSTGADGSIDLVQDGTTLSIAANTALELLAGPTAGSLLKRVVQSQGSAFYDVAPRESDKLRVETPYLVAVIKGTQFNVTVAEESTSVALFEGRLQIDAPDTGDTVDLEAGHIARRAKGDPRITVLRMDDGEPVARAGSAPATGSSNGNGAPPSGIAEDVGDDAGLMPGETGNELPETGVAGGAGSTPPGDDTDDGSALASPELEFVTGDSAAPGAGLGGGGGPLVDVSNDLKIGSDGLDLDAAAAIDAGALGISADVGAGIDLAAGQLDVDLGVGLDVADVGVDADIAADIDLGSGDIGLDLDAGLDVADIGVDAGIGADIDLGGGDIGLDLDAGLDVADVGVDAGLGADVDLGGGDLGLDLDAGLEVADVGVDAGLGADVDLGDGDLGLGLDAGVDVGGTGVDAGADVDLGGGDIGVDVGVGDVGLGVGVDTGLDGGGAGLDVDLDLDGLDNVTDLVDGLLGGGNPAAEEEEEDEDPAPLLPDLGDLLGL